MSIRRSMVAALAALGLLVAGLAFSSLASAAEALETPATDPATGVTATSATLNGELNPGTGSAESEYRFFYTPGTECGGTAAPEPAGKASGNHQAESQTITGLQPNLEYAFCLTTFNETESLSGQTKTFVTTAIKPGLEQQSSLSVTPFDAVLEAQINPNNEETTVTAEYATNPTLTGATPVTGSIVPSSFGNQLVRVDIGGTLAPSTTYYYRVIATNDAGTTDGTPVRSFTTLAAGAPIVEAQSTSGVTPSGATLEARVNPYYEAATTTFEYATNPALTGATPVTGSALASGFGGQTASAGIGGLTPNTVYYYRVVATNATGTTDGTPVQSFHTPSEPLIVPGASSDITRTTATLAGTVTPVGATTEYHFIYGPTTSYGQSSAVLSAGEGFAEVAATAELEELQAGTTYHYALVASNYYGTVTGPDQTFTTAPAVPPVVSTGEAGGVGHEGATITGTLETNGLPTTYAFQLGTEAGVYSSQGYNAISGAGPQAVSLELQYLAAGVTYHYRLVASNHDGTTYGQDQTFTTAGYPSPLAALPASPPLIVVAPAAITPPPVVTSKPAPKPKKPVKHKKKKKKAKKKKKKK